MKTRISPSLVGFFVLGFLVLGVIALLSFGGVNFFSKPQRFVVFFDESIHGLDLGSPVKLRGVRVGRVVDLALNYDEKANTAVVAVTCEFNKNMMKNRDGVMIDVSKRERLEALVASGMRAQLGVQGLATGLLFVELDFVDTESQVPAPTGAPTTLAVVPSMRSAIAEFQASLTEILSNVKNVDFPTLGREIQGLLADTRKQVNAMNLGEVTREWSRAGAAVTRLAESEDLQKIAGNINRTIARIDQTVAHIDAAVEPASGDLAKVLSEAREALTAFKETAQNARSFISAQSGLSDEAARALMKFSEAADSISKLADFIERNPNALLTGRKK
ncbi:MlaD family protein [Nibricoccus sp. IMCC34717]|uniref:MlaD family protein n=1 Tax=Nibricoccus sp. IMCC34717 TaxID=3034021 RepID=UPI00384F1E0F